MSVSVASPVIVTTTGLLDDVPPLIWIGQLLSVWRSVVDNVVEDEMILFTGKAEDGVGLETRT